MHINVYLIHLSSSFKESPLTGYLQISKSIPDTDLLKGNAILLSEASRDDFYSFAHLQCSKQEKGRCELSNNSQEYSVH